MKLKHLHQSGCIVFSVFLFGLTLHVQARNFTYMDTPAKEHSAAKSGKTDTQGPLLQTYEVALPPASYFYDFEGNGEKGFVQVKESDIKDSLFIYNGISQDFSKIKNTGYPVTRQPNAGGKYNLLMTIDDINKDGYPDYGISSGTYNSKQPNVTLLSNPDGTYNQLPATLLYNWDVNRDGRVDLISEIKKPATGSSFSIHRQQPNKALIKLPMKTIAYDAYNNNFDPTAWYEARQSSGLGKLPPSSTAGWGLSGASLEPRTPPMPSKIPSLSIDLNKDGITDLIDPTEGTIYYGTPEGCYVMSSTGGTVVTKDLNDDRISDFIIHGGKEGILRTLVYQGAGKFKETLLLDNLAADDDIYCYDFDKDGDVDLLVTFSSPATAGTAYTLFYENDGKGNFISHEDYAQCRWIFSNCRDIDNDGYYDLLLIDYDEYETDAHTLKVTLRRGMPGFKLGEAEELFNTNSQNGYTTKWLTTALKVNAEDIDNDGFTEIWLSTIQDSPSFPATSIYKVLSSRINSAPERPTAPTLTYHAATGQLNIDWSPGSDAECSNKDLTYALRIGTAPGKGDIVYANALSDGSRKNFLNGNAGFDLSKTFDTRTWQTGLYYVSIQTIDPHHKGSAWSEDVTFYQSYIPAEFTVSANTLSTSDMLTVNYTQAEGYQYNWNTDDATIVEPVHDGEVRLRWASDGQKKISLTVKTVDGLSAIYETEVCVLSDKIAPTDNNFTLTTAMRFADYDMDGYADYAGNDGLYHNNKSDKFTKASGIFNQGLAYTDALWIDYDMDGMLDLFYQPDVMTPKYGVLKNNRNGNFTKISSPDISVINNSGDSYNSCFRLQYMFDLNNDGFSESYFSNSLFINRDNKEFEWRLQKTIENPDYPIDWNQDGFMDFYNIKTTGNTCAGIEIMRNTGDYQFTEEQIPFDKIISTENINYPRIVDFDNDGYLDIIFWKNEKVIHVLKNKENKIFTEGYDILLDGVTINPKKNRFQLFDLDNNGYLDIIFTAKNTLQGDSIAFFAIYVDEPGKYRQGFISPGQYFNNIYDEDAFMDLKPFITISPDGIPFIDAGNQFNGEKTIYFNNHQTKVTNTQPQAPEMVTAMQTDSTVLIQWNAAKDKETPYTQMRYNLSVKKKGSSGAESYIVSPLNGGNSDMAALSSNGLSKTFYRSHFYTTATCFEIPLSALPVGELEIQVQSIDLWASMSEFSVPFTIQIVNKPLLQCPATSCLESPVTITYKGTQDPGAIPVWNFDDGHILSGQNWGPYEVQWSQSGVKNVSVEVGMETSSVNVKILPDFSPVFKMPNQVFFETDITITLPEVLQNASFEWKLSDDPYPYNDLKIIAIPGKKEATLRITGHPELSRRELTLTVIQNGCEKRYTHSFSILPKIEPPVLSLVYAENNKNIISWNPENLPTDCSQIIIYKEGAYLNDFREIGRVDKHDAKFADIASNVMVKSERYAISMWMIYDVESPISNIHQTIHLTINRGVADNQFNLIWNTYQGRDAASYRILKGASANTLQEITLLPGSVTSFTDMAPDASKPYYALDFTPVEEDFFSTISPKTKNDAAIVARTNIVYSGDARDINYVNRLEILTVEKEALLNEQQQTLYLYAEVFPVNATYQQVTWSITDGNHLATIDNYGKLQALGNGQSGKVTVQAKAIDASGIIATRSVPIEGFSTPVEPPTHLNVNINGQSVELSWEGSAQEYIVAYHKKGAEEPIESRTVSEKNFIPEQITTGFVYEWMVTAKNGNMLSETVFGPEFRTEGVDLINITSNSIMAFPMPVKDFLYLRPDKNIQIEKIELVDLQGRIVQRWHKYVDSLDLQQTKAGILLLRLYTNTGVITKKIMKE